MRYYIIQNNGTTRLITAAQLSQEKKPTRVVAMGSGKNALKRLSRYL